MGAVEHVPANATAVTESSEENGEEASVNDQKGQVRSGVPRGTNCIDACILEYLSRSGRFVTDLEYGTCVDAIGLKEASAFRSLAECVEIMNYFGCDIVAIPFTTDKNATFPPLAIAYIPPDRHGRIGHVVLLEDSGDDRVTVWDPSNKDLTRIVDPHEIKYPFTTIFLVPRSHIRRSYVTTFVVTMLAVSFFLFCSALFNRIRGRPRPATDVIIAVFATMLSGCSGEAPKTSTTSTLSVAISPLFHDFGNLDPRELKEEAVKSFTVSNLGETPIVCRVNPDCSCIVSEPASSALEVLPGDEAVFQLKVSLHQKAGDFQQNIFVSITELSDVESNEGQSLDTQVKESRFSIRLNGFVQRHPLPLRKTVHIKALSGQTSTGVVQITHARAASTQPLSLADVRIIKTVSNTLPVHADAPPRTHGDPIASGEEVTASSSSFFEAGEVRFTAGNEAGNKCIDLWEIPVKFTASRQVSPFGRLLAKGELQVSWKGGSEPNEVTSCELLGELIRPIEVPRKFLAGEGVAGLELIAAVPVRFNSQERLDEYKFECPSQVRAQLDEGSRSLMVWVVGDKIGDFSHQIRVLLDGEEVASVELVGRMTEKR